MKYFQRVQSDDYYFRYEYWWVTHRDIFGPRLVKVRIPPTNGPAKGIPWEFLYDIDAGDSSRIYYEQDRDDFIWIDYIHQPDTIKFDMRSK